MNVLKPGRRARPERRRVKIAPTVAPLTVTSMTTICQATEESRGELIDRLVALELKRMRRRQ